MTVLAGPEALHTHPDIADIEYRLASVALQHEASSLNAPDTRPLHEQVLDQVLQEIADNPDASLPERSTEDGENDDWVFGEQYSHSLRPYQEVGRHKIAGTLETPEGRAAKAKLHGRFMSSAAEMVHTSPGYRDVLEINRRRTYPIHDGHVTDIDGKTRLLNVAVRGFKSAAAEAATKPFMGPIAAHNGADVRVAQRANELSVGEGFLGITADLQEAMEEHGEPSYDALGWRRGLIFLQGHLRTGKHTMETFAYSVDHSDLDIWREVLAEFGCNIPTGEKSPTWLDHDMSLSGDPETADRFIRSIRARFYEKMGITTVFHCVDEFIDDNQETCDQIFESLGMDLTVASVTYELSPVLAAFVDSILSGGRYLKSGIRNQLHALRQAEQLVDSDIALIEQLIRYSVPERLRPALALLGTEKEAKVTMLVAPPGVLLPMHVAANAGGGVINGARHNRTYGGCTPSIDLGSDADSDSSNSYDRTKSKKGSEESSENGNIPKTIKCIKCRKPSPKAEVIHVDEKSGTGFWECPHCHYWLDVCTGKDGYRNTGSEKVEEMEDIWRHIAAAVGISQPLGRHAAANN